MEIVGMKKLLLLTGFLIALNPVNIRAAVMEYHGARDRFPLMFVCSIGTVSALMVGFIVALSKIPLNNSSNSKTYDSQLNKKNGQLHKQLDTRDKEFDIKDGIYFIKAPWCSHCKRVSPIIEQISEDFKNKAIDVRVIDYQDNDSLSRINVTIHGYPTIIYVSNHRLYGIVEGGVTYQSAADTLNKILSIKMNIEVFGNSVDNPADFAIIGAGPAGSSAAHYLARNHVKTVLFGKQTESTLAGVKEVNNWPGSPAIPGAQLSFNLWKEAMRADVNVHDDNIVDIDTAQQPMILTADNGNHYFAKNVILATGKTPCRPDVPGLKEYWGKGIGVCALCDAALYKDKKVVLYGQHDVNDTLLHLLKIAKKVTLIIPEPELIDSATIELVQKYDVSLIKDTQLVKISGNDSHIAGISLQLGECHLEEDVDALFIALGNEPNNALAKKLDLELDEKGYVRVKQTQETSREGIFAAGDITSFSYKQAFLASAQGLLAAIVGYKHLTVEKTD
jgi:thioredoxin reductase (NADPH)